ncbi:hypothetical protein D3C81_1555590 [compost metagenome]
MGTVHHANEAILEQGPATQLRTGRLADHAGFQVDAAVAQRRAVLVEFLQEKQAYAGGFGAQAGDQARAEIFHETVAGAQGEGASQLPKVQLFGRTQHRFGLLHQLPDLLAQGDGARGWHQAASGPDQQRVAGGAAQSRQRPAHRRGAQL